MPKLTELTATATLSNSDLIAVSTNTGGVAVSNSANVQVLINATHASSGSDFTSHVKFTVDAVGDTAFTFSGAGAQGTGNETLYLYRGLTYQFNLSNTVANDHGWEIRTIGGTKFVNGQSNNSSGNVVYFTVPQNASGNLVYQCLNHDASNGTIVIV